MTWKEELIDLHRKVRRPYVYSDEYENAKEQDEASINELDRFISSKFAELIDEASGYFVDDYGMAEELKRKWL